MWDGKGKMSMCIVRIFAKTGEKKEKALIKGTSLPLGKIPPFVFIIHHISFFYSSFSSRSFVPFPSSDDSSPRSGRLPAAGDGELRPAGWRGARRQVSCCRLGEPVAEEKAGGSPPAAAAAVCGRVGTRPAAPSRLLRRLSRGQGGYMKNSRVAFVASLTCLAQGGGGRGRRDKWRRRR